MWIVKLALRRPYTFVVVSLLLILLGIGASSKMPRDIFPPISEPIVTIIWQYPGFPPDDMANQIAQWKRDFLDHAADIFSRSGKQEQAQQDDEQTEPLYRKIGQLQIENDFLKKKLLS